MGATKKQLSEETVQKMLETDKAKLNDIPAGKVKSGRVWKEKGSKFSGLLIQKPNRSSWQNKMDKKNTLKNLKGHEATLKEQKKQKKLELVARQKLNEERRKINEKKSEVVQSIKSAAKFKKVKKHLIRKV